MGWRAVVPTKGVYQKETNMTDTIHTVTVALLTQDGNVLLLQRDPAEYPGHGDAWELIGGHIEERESPADAARREVAEETGIVGVSPRYCDASSFKAGALDALNFVYLVRLEEQLDVTLSPEHKAYKWTDMNEARTMKLANKHSQILGKILEHWRKEVTQGDVHPGYQRPVLPLASNRTISATGVILQTNSRTIPIPAQFTEDDDE